MPGFIIGVVSSVIAALLLAWAISITDPKYKRLLLAFVSNPLLQLQIRTPTQKREVAHVINRIFEAWEVKDIENYMSCWHPDTRRIEGSHGSTIMSLTEIREKFANSCKKYSDIKSEFVIFESIRLNYPKRELTMVYVYYRQLILAEETQLPIIEEARDIYILSKSGGKWVIRSNFDHFAPVGRVAA